MPESLRWRRAAGAPSRMPVPAAGQRGPIVLLSREEARAAAKVHVHALAYARVRRSKRVRPTLLVFALLVGGCLASPANDAPVRLGEADGLSVDSVVGDDPAARTLDAAPRFASGEWWRVETTDVFSATTREFTVVVAGIEGESYLFGLPAEDASQLDDLMGMHIPPLGDVGRSDLSFWVHEPFVPLRFPVRDGDAWETHFEFGAVNVTVQVLDATRAEVRTDGPFPVTATYDASAGWFTSMRSENFGEWTLLDHGYGHEGELLVPRGQVLAWLTGRFGGAFDFAAKPAAPVAEATLDERLDRVSTIVFLGGGPGHFREADTAPDGERFEYETTVTAAELVVEMYGRAQPEGTWTFEHLATGSGIAASEAVAYELYTVRLPDGPVARHDGSI